MKEYLDFLVVILITTLTIGIVGVVAVGGYLIYKFIKDED
jgi:uncharacterized membrane protein